ncbi:site-specific DNA-methyltransferase [Paenibacillus sp. P22]|uniref:DNA-methyltransferase n=1 Tax=Paenibacillus sp. P22 TaxID=483908 RepID=UPI0022B66C74|nr:site-specific DNA-methyltransferase [Paenibacillus sp. P22]
MTDPPYGLSKEPNAAEVLTKWIAGEPYDHGHGGFMGKAWDSFVPHPDVWKEVHRVLKPGGYALVFAGTRTQDLMTVSLRLAGFEVRDVIEWLYFSGFPKSMDVSKALDKRAGAEREKVRHKARPETSGTMSGSSDTRPWIEESRKRGYHEVDGKIPVTDLARQWDGWGTALKPAHEPIIVVRKPLAGTVADNVERHGTGAINIDGCRIGRVESDRAEYGVSGDEPSHTGDTNGHTYGIYGRVAYVPNESGRFPANAITTDADAFYSPYFNVSPREISKKASKADRGAGNTHPTVKPTDLMAWLVRLVTPPGGTVLDPFAGSGSTLVAAKREGFNFIGIEREPEYVEIIKARTGTE